MKILDRYVLLTFLKNYVISFGVLLAMFVTLDMVMNLDEFFEITQKVGDAASKGAAPSGLENAFRMLRNIADYYTYQSLLIYVYMAPIVPVVAASFTLLRMTRFNELIAILAAGQSLRRTAAPIIIAATVMTVLVWPLQELIIPAVIPKLVRQHSDAGSDAVRSFPVDALEDGQSNILVASRFTPATATAPATLIEVDLIQRDEHRQPVSHILASRAFYDTKTQTWRLSTPATISAGLAPNQVPKTSTLVDKLPTTITPEEIVLYRSRDFVELLSTSRIDQLLAAPRNYGIADLLRVKHFRVTGYLNNVLLLLLALPCVMTREPRTLRTGGMFLLGVTGLYLGMIFVAQHLAGLPPPSDRLSVAWPAMMAWMPVMIFGPAAVYAMDKIRT